MVCQLCLCEAFMNLESEKSENFVVKVEKYLLIKMDNKSSEVCLSCYNSLENFHEFYEQVHKTQRTLQTVLIDNEISSVKEIVCEISNAQSDNVNLELPLDSLQENCADDETKMYNCKNELPDDTTNGDEKCTSSTLNLKSPKAKHKRLSKIKKITNDIEKKMVEFYNIKCEKCDDLKFTSFKMLSKHYLTVHNTQGYIKCCKRNIRVSDKSYLRSHMFKHLQPDTCRCAVCGKELSSLVTLKNHMLLHKPAEERPFQCSDCDKRFCCKNDLKNHEKAIHLPESEREDFICDVCGKVFQKVANLRYHHSTIHLQERKYICEICAKCFTTRSGLRTHMNAAHNTSGPIQCQECKKWLKNEDTFQKHQQLHQNTSYPCPLCDKICNSSASLRSHMVKHSEERPYFCHICRKSFKTKTHLKNHSVQHTGGTNFKCPYCSKTFVNMSNYYTHRKRMHSAERQGLKPEEKLLTMQREVSVNTPEMHVEDLGNDSFYQFKITKPGLENDTHLIQNGMPLARLTNVVPSVDVKY